MQGATIPTTMINTLCLFENLVFPLWIFLGHGFSIIVVGPAGGFRLCDCQYYNFQHPSTDSTSSGRPWFKSMGKKRQRDEGQAGGGGGGGGKGGRGLSGEKAAGWQVPRIPLSDMSSARFVEEFMIPNLPVIITGLVEPWPVSDLDILFPCSDSTLVYIPACLSVPT
jgi:hypothetical protein